jgi:hypothetical protein
MTIFHRLSHNFETQYLKKILESITAAALMPKHKSTDVPGPGGEDLITYGFFSAVGTCLYVGETHGRDCVISLGEGKGNAELIRVTS